MNLAAAGMCLPLVPSRKCEERAAPSAKSSAACPAFAGSQSSAEYFSQDNFYLFIYFSPPQLLSSISVIVPPTDSSYGNRDITADIAIHKNSSGWGPVARRAPLGKVIGQAAKGRESAEHVVLHPGDFTLLPLFSLSHAKVFFFFSPSLFFFFPPSLYSPLNYRRDFYNGLMSWWWNSCTL